MRKTFDPSASAIYVYLDDTAEVIRSVNICDSMNIDFASNNQPVGIEVLNVNDAGVPLDMEEISRALAEHSLPAGASGLITQPCGPGRKI
jgi:uncharacterized protein YuzE